jgi:hypothetical protein
MPSLVKENQSVHREIIQRFKYFYFDLSLEYGKYVEKCGTRKEIRVTKWDDYSKDNV